MPPPIVRWCLLLVVMMPIVAPLPLPLLVLWTICRLLSVDALPPVSLLFASWLLHCPCCCAAAAASCPLNMPSPPPNEPPPPCNAPPPLVCWRLSSCLPLFCWLSYHISSCRRLKCPSLTPTFICTSWLLHHISLHCFCLPSSCQHRRLLMRWQPTSRLPLVRPNWLSLVRPNWLSVCLTWYAQ